LSRFGLATAGKALVIGVLAAEAISIPFLIHHQQHATGAVAVDVPVPKLAASHENLAGGYKFDYPHHWTVSDSGRVSQLRHAKAIVSVAPIPRGWTANESVLSRLLTESYSRVHITRRDERTLAGGVVMRTLAGRSMNARGHWVRFTLTAADYRVSAYAFARFSLPGRATDSSTKTLRLVEKSFKPSGEIE
jgi:hypothetical protein